MLLILIDRVFNNIELCYTYPFIFCIFLIGTCTRIQPQLLFLMEKSILYSNNSIAEEILSQNSVLNIIIGLFFSNLL